MAKIERMVVTGPSGKTYIATAQRTGINFGWLPIIRHANGRLVKALYAVFATPGHAAAAAATAAAKM